MHVVGAAFACAVLAQSAAAQDPNTDPSAVTVIGNDSHARRCINGVSQGDTSDTVLAECARGLTNPRLTRGGAVLLHTDRGVAYLRRQQTAEAIADFDAVLALEPNNAEARLNRGTALVIAHQPGAAVAELTQALSLGVSEPEKAYYNRAAAREQLGDLRGAYEDYNTALEIRPDWGPANEQLARFARSRREHLANILAQQQQPSSP